MRAAGLCVAAVTAILCVTLTVPAPAQEAAPGGPLSLADARARAQRSALQVALARWDREAARGEVARWTGAALPSVAGFVDLTTGAGLTPSGFRRPTASLFVAGVSGSVRLFDPATWAAAAAARRTLRGEEETVGWARARARQQATDLFVTVALEQQVAAALEDARESAEQDAGAVRELVAAGLRPPSDAARTRADAMDLGARAIEARGRMVAACAGLQDLMAVAIDGECTLAPLPADPVPAEASGPHPALVAAEEAVAAARAAQFSAVGAQLPTVQAQGQVAHYEIPGGQGGLGWGVGVGVDVPLRGVTEGRGEVMGAAARAGSAEESLEGQERSLRAARIAAEAEFEAATAAVLAREGAVEAAAAALLLVQERYRAGLADVSGLLDARRAGIDAEVGLLRARARRWSALAAVEAAAGVQE